MELNDDHRDLLSQVGLLINTMAVKEVACVAIESPRAFHFMMILLYIVIKLQLMKFCSGSPHTSLPPLTVVS